MKHNITHRKLNRTTSHRKALLMNLSNSLIKHEQITTTLSKAKELELVIKNNIINNFLIFLVFNNFLGQYSFGFIPHNC